MARPAPLSPSRQHPLMLVWQPCYRCSGRPLRFAVFRNAFRERLRAAVARQRVALLDWLALPDGFLLLCDPGSLAQLAGFVGTLKRGVAADARRRRPDCQLWRGRYALTLVQPAALTQCLLTMDLAATAGGLVLHPAAWTHSGWHELASLRRRYRILLPVAADAALASAAPCFAAGHSPDPGRHSYVALTEQCLRQRRHGALQAWTAALAVGQPEWIERLLALLPEASRHLSTIAPADLPLDTPAPLLAVTAGRRRSRDLVHRILRAVEAQA